MVPKGQSQLIQCNVPVVQSECSNVLSCNVFINYFNRNIATVFPHIPKNNILPINPLIINGVGVERVPVNLKVSSSAGPDCNSSKILQ